MSREALLSEGYRRCAKLTWDYGTTYFWGAALLPKPQRKHVYAVYALCRLANDIVDLPSDQHVLLPDHNPRSNEWGAIPNEPTPTSDPIDRQAAVSAQLKGFAAEFRTSLTQGGSTDPVMAAVVTQSSVVALSRSASSASSMPWLWT
jgi:phytoene synthase